MSRARLHDAGFRILVIVSILVWFFVIIVSLFILQLRGHLKPYAAGEANFGVSARGRVIDSSDIGIFGARLTISANGLNNYFYTDSTGRFEAGGIVPGEYLVKVEAKNFKTHESMILLDAKSDYSFILHGDD